MGFRRDFSEIVGVCTYNVVRISVAILDFRAEVIRAVSV